MKLSNKESNFYISKMKSLGINQRIVLKEMYSKNVSIKELSNNMDYCYMTVYNNVKGIYFNPKLLFEAYSILSKINLLDEKPEWVKNISKEQKNLGGLLINGFSYWEASRIIN